MRCMVGINTYKRWEFAAKHLEDLLIAHAYGHRRKSGDERRL